MSGVVVEFGPVILDVDFRQKSVLVKDTGIAFIDRCIPGRWLQATFRVSGLKILFRPEAGTDGKRLCRGPFKSVWDAKERDGRITVKVLTIEDDQREIILRTGCSFGKIRAPRGMSVGSLDMNVPVRH